MKATKAIINKKRNAELFANNDKKIKLHHNIYIEIFQTITWTNNTGNHKRDSQTLLY